MDVDAPRGLLRAFAELEDPRMDRTKEHKLSDILTIAICASICGVDDWTKMEFFGNCKQKWFRTFLELPNGIPSHDTFRRVFMLLNPDAFEACFMRWVDGLVEASGGRLIAVDGKSLRGSLDRPRIDDILETGDGRSIAAHAAVAPVALRAPCATAAETFPMPTVPPYSNTELVQRRGQAE
ncbi:MAG: ISAs1 family transposase [Phycisphaerae bacterium]